MYASLLRGIHCGQMHQLVHYLGDDVVLLVVVQLVTLMGIKQVLQLTVLL
jgi:ribulose 1,5-bisphosphate carboxylase large subunit-like protein